MGVAKSGAGLVPGAAGAPGVRAGGAAAQALAQAKGA